MAILGGARLRRQNRGELSPERIATALYRGILGREPDPPGLVTKAKALRSGEVLERVVETFIGSPEFRSRFLSQAAPPFQLPDLTAAMPERYERQPAHGAMLPERYERQPAHGAMLNVFIARDDADMNLMAGLIEQHRFYDRFGVWSPVIDLDKQITAATVLGLGAKSCFELGCFTGPVLSLLAEAGVGVTGADVSHLAFAFAYPNIRASMLYGDLLTLKLDRTFDVVLCMDVLEHLNPVLLDAHIGKLVSLVGHGGFLYLNAPMWGDDRVFGVFEEPYLAEWHAVGDEGCWRHWPCDEQGWPLHGHLVWASSPWWERKFAQHGLVRDTLIERAIHQKLARFFSGSVGRRSLFVLRRPDDRSSSEATAAQIAAALEQIPELPR